MGRLFVVATPIGNLEDLTHRAARVLRKVPLIAAEDTRTTGKLLAYYQIDTPLISFHDHSRPHQIDLLIDKLRQDDLALVSDAGTPGINDPGYSLIQAALEAGLPVIPLPGPSAPVTALSVSGLPTDSFLYLGYLPRKSKKRRELLSRIRRQPHTLIFLESPHRLLDSLGDLTEILGARKIAVGREMTKLHEEFFRGTLPEALSHFQENRPRGEFTLVVQGAEPEHQRWTREEVETALREARTTDRSASQIARELADQSGWDRRTLYDLLNQIT